MSWNSIMVIDIFNLLVSYCMIAASTIESPTPQHLVDYILLKHKQICHTDRFCSFNVTAKLSENCRSCVRCQCDSKCKLYGDCCPDFLFSDSPPPPHTAKQKPRYECQSHAFKLAQHSKSTEHFFSIGTCTSFNDPRLVFHCHSPNKIDPYMNRPVTSASEVYRNEFCAQCNGETEYKPWYFRLACTIPLSVPSTMTMDIVKYFIHQPQCSVFFIPPDNTHARRCYADSSSLITTCNETGAWQDYDAMVASACEAYYSPVIHRSKSFKNIFCFDCNTVTQNKPNISCELDISEQFSVLLNPDKTQKLQRQTEDSCRCQNDEVLHKFKKVCRPLICSYGRTLEGKRCVSSYTSTENSPYSLEMTLTPAENIHMAPDTVNWMSSFALGITATFKETIEGYDIEIHMLRLRSVMKVNKTRVLRVILLLHLILRSEHRLDEFESLLIDLQNSKWRIPFEGRLLNMSSAFSKHFNESELDNHIKNETILTSNDNYYYLTYTYMYYLNNINFTLSPTSYTEVSRTLFCPLVKLDFDETTQLGNRFVLVATNLTLSLNEMLVTADGTVVICHDVIQGTNVCNLQEIFTEKYKLVSRICLGLSLVCLFVTLVVFLLFSSLRTLPGKNIMGLISTLFVAIALNLFGIRRVKTETLCKVIGIFMHLFLLSSFTWTGICTFHMYRVFTSVIKSRKSFTRKNLFSIYLCITIIIPVLIVLAVIGINYAVHGLTEVGYGTGGCYVSNYYSIIIGIFFPLSVVLLLNFTLFILTVVSLRKMSVEHHRLTGKKDKVYTYVKLSSLTGINWVFAFLAPLTGVQEFWYVFAVLCGLQGVYIFLAFVCNRRVLKLFRNMFQGRDLILSDTTGHNVQTSSTQPNTIEKQISHEHRDVNEGSTHM